MKSFKLVIGLTAFLLVADVSAQNNQDNSIKDFRERDEIRQTVPLKPGTRVEVVGIRGSIEIKTANITVAEIHIVRSARSRVDLEQFKIGIEHNTQSLIIHGETRQRNSGAGFGPDVHHQVILRLPREVNLSINSISGQVRIGDIGGTLSIRSVSGSVSVGVVAGGIQVSSISGSVNIVEANKQVEIKSVGGDIKIARLADSLNIGGVTGSVTVGVTGLGQCGIEINSVSGGVELRLQAELNAEVKASSISGKISIEVRNAVMESPPTASSIRASIGKGGPPISINGVTKGVRIL